MNGDRATSKVTTNGRGFAQAAFISGDGRKVRKYDLEDRLLEYAADVIRFTDSMSKSDAGRHVGSQLLRSGTSPLAHQGEAQAAESAKDFVHKMRVALKELRESLRWVKLVRRVPLTKELDKGAALQRETDELIRIFVTSIRTAGSNSLRPKP